ncbi:hypothetical protein M8J75_010780 [Diaphorina citri]|nr:hypothetical protein M8J75_010780 [Diaphorina citri]
MRVNGKGLVTVTTRRSAQAVTTRRSAKAVCPISYFISPQHDSIPTNPCFLYLSQVSHASPSTDGTFDPPKGSR